MPWWNARLPCIADRALTRALRLPLQTAGLAHERGVSLLHAGNEQYGKVGGSENVASNAAEHRRARTEHDDSGAEPFGRLKNGESSIPRLSNHDFNSATRWRYQLSKPSFHLRMCCSEDVSFIEHGEPVRWRSDVKQPQGQVGWQRRTSVLNDASADPRQIDRDQRRR